MATTRPRRRSIMPGSTACVACTTPMKLTFIIRWNNAASERPKGADSAAPALAMRMSTGWRAAAAASADLTETSSATSATSANFAAPALTASSSVARLRPRMVTTAPASVRGAAPARPMPRPPPVTTAWEECESFDMLGPFLGLPAREQLPIYFKLKTIARPPSRRPRLTANRPKLASPLQQIEDRQHGGARKGYHAKRHRLFRQDMEYPWAGVFSKGRHRLDLRVRDQQRSRPVRAGAYPPDPG